MTIPQAKARRLRFSGPLAKLMAESESGKPNFARLVEAEKKHQIEDVGSRLRGLMPWLAANKIVDKAKN